jgi:hypothetical protein
VLVVGAEFVEAVAHELEVLFLGYVVYPQHRSVVSLHWILLSEIVVEKRAVALY